MSGRLAALRTRLAARVRTLAVTGDATADVCLNCETPLVGPYCAACGQRALPPRPTLRELAEEAWGEFVSLDGRFLTTMRLLLARPGVLTRETLLGRRARYLGPVRLYLLCSVTYFLASAALPGHGFGERKAEARTELGDAVGTTIPESCRPSKTRVPAMVQRIREIDCKSDREPERFEQALRANRPRLMFVLLPLYAAILALAFRGPTYPEHLIFALHLHAFVFLGILVARSADLLPWRKADAVVDAVVWVGIVAYSLVALRRVYGRSRGGTLLRSVLVAGTYGILFVLGLVGVMFVAAMQM